MAKEEDRRDTRAAYHEAGHAVIGWCFGRRVEHVTIVPSGGGCGGHVLYRTDRVFEWVQATDTWLRIELLVTIAGSEAQKMELGGEVWEDGGGIDPDVGVLQDTDADLAGDLLLRIDESRADIESGAAYERFETETLDLLDEFWPEVERVAEALLKERTLSQERLTELLEL